jgi:hypothetical protein
MTDLSAYSVDPVKGLTWNGPPPGANGAGHAAPVDSFAAFAALAALLADPAATLAKMKELSDREAEVDRKLNAVSAAEARLAKKEQALAEKEAALKTQGIAQQKAYADLDKWKKIERDEFDEANAILVEKARRWDRIQPPDSIDLSRSDGGQSVRDLHSGQFAHVGQVEEARAARRSPSDLAAEHAVAETPEVEFPAGTSISRSPPKRRG